MEDKYTKRIALKTVLLAQLFIESLDELKDTTLFKQGTKNLINRIDKDLTPLVKEHYDKMYSEDVQNSIDVLDTVVEEIVHNAVVDVNEVEKYNLFIVRGKNGSKTKIKTKMSPKEFEKQYKVKLR